MGAQYLGEVGALICTTRRIGGIKLATGHVLFYLQCNGLFALHSCTNAKIGWPVARQCKLILLAPRQEPFSSAQFGTLACCCQFQGPRPLQPAAVHFATVYAEVRNRLVMQQSCATLQVNTTCWRACAPYPGSQLWSWPPPSLLQAWHAATAAMRGRHHLSPPHQQSLKNTHAHI